MKMAERFAQRRDFLGLLKLIAQGEADVRRGKTPSQKARVCQDGGETYQAPAASMSMGWS